MNWIILAQAAPVDSGASPDQMIGWAERMSRGGVPVIALTVAIAATVGIIFMFKKLVANADKFTELERSYRKTIEDKAAQDRIDAEARRKEEKAEGDKRENDKLAMMRERLVVEKESDKTLANAILVIENNTKLAEKVDRKLDGLADLGSKLNDVIDRLRRLEDRRPT